jgi:hypothetical protein
VSEPTVGRVAPTAWDWADAVVNVRSHYPEDVFPEGGTTIDAQSASMARLTCDNIALEARRLAVERCPHEYWNCRQDGTTYCRACGADTTHMDAMGG